MSLEPQIRFEIKNSMKNGDEISKNILRLVLGEFQLKSANSKLSDEDQIKIIQKMIKNNLEIINLISDNDKIDVLKTENKILEKFLPRTMTEEETKEYVLSLGLDFSGMKTGQRIGLVRKTGKPDKLIDNSILMKVVEFL